MVKIKTRRLEKRPTRKAAAMGLHAPSTRRTYLFRDVSQGPGLDRYVIIGRAPKCNISLDDPYVSTIHARLELRDGVMWVKDRSSDKATFLDGEPVIESMPLLMGMELQVGNTLLVGTDAEGRIPVSGRTFSEMCRTAVGLYGSIRLAAKRLGKSHTFMRAQMKPRTERQRKSA